jgi:hypothetical protein
VLGVYLDADLVQRGLALLALLAQLVPLLGHDRDLSDLGNG